MKNLANRITVFRIILVPAFVVLAYLNHRYTAAVLFAVACISDAIDGYIARKYSQITAFGKFMDPLADKILVLSAMCFFIDRGVMPGWAVAVVLLREFIVSGLRLIAIEKNVIIAAGWSGKIKTASTMVAIMLMMVFPNRIHNIAGTAVILVTTVYSGIEYIVLNRKVFNEEI